MKMLLTLLAIGSFSAARLSGQSFSEAQTVVNKEVLPVARKIAEAKKPAPAKASAAQEAKVEDIGGAFIYSNDPATLAQWYKDKLGIELSYEPGEGTYFYVFVRGKVPGANTVFAIKTATSKLAAERNQFMVNFRVNDFDSFIKRLKAKGVAIDRTEDFPGFGRFGWIKDLEGNPIEFWQPTK